MRIFVIYLLPSSLISTGPAVYHPSDRGWEPTSPYVSLQGPSQQGDTLPLSAPKGLCGLSALTSSLGCSQKRETGPRSKIWAIVYGHYSAEHVVHMCYPYHSAKTYKQSTRPTHEAALSGKA